MYKESYAKMVDKDINQLKDAKINYKEFNKAEYLGNVGGTDIFRYKDVYYFSNVATGECEAYDYIEQPMHIIDVANMFSYKDLMDEHNSPNMDHVRVDMYGVFIKHFNNEVYGEYKMWLRSAARLHYSQ